MFSESRNPVLVRLYEFSSAVSSPEKSQLFLLGFLEVCELDGIFAREAGVAEALAVKLPRIIYGLHYAFQC